MDEKGFRDHSRVLTPPIWETVERLSEIDGELSTYWAIIQKHRSTSRERKSVPEHLGITHD